MKKLTAIFLLSLILFVPLVTLAQAQAPASTNPCTVAGVKASPDKIGTTLPQCVNRIYIWALGLSVLLAFMMMVLGGYYIMTAAGNAEQATKGKEYITSSIIGVTILFLAYLLLNEINPDLVNFNLDSIQKLEGTPAEIRK